jgi:hypothetical protein
MTLYPGPTVMVRIEDVPAYQEQMELFFREGGKGKQRTRRGRDRRLALGRELLDLIEQKGGKRHDCGPAAGITARVIDAVMKRNWPEIDRYMRDDEDLQEEDIQEAIRSYLKSLASYARSKRL